MNFVERVLEFDDWPTNRKSALLMLVALAFHLLVSPGAYFFGRSSELVDSGLLYWVIISGALTVIVLLAVSCLSMLQRSDGRWTAYAIVFTYGSWILMNVYLTGFWATAFFGWAPAVILLVSIWFDERVGLVALIYAVIAVGGGSALVVREVFPFAPILLDTSLNGQLDGAWAAAALIPLGGVTVFAFVTASLSVVVRRQQAAKLAEAYRLIRRYAPSQVTEIILQGQHVEEFRPQRLKLTIFFSDVEGFTHASDQLDPEELAQLLNQYLSEMAQIASRFGATINQFVGDGIMLFFGAPKSAGDRENARRALQMALAMQRRISELNDMWIERGIVAPFRVRMGVNTGYASVGDFGSNERKEYTAIGIQTNIAARIQAECKPGSILVSESTQALVARDFEFDPAKEFNFKGIHYPVRVFELRAESRPNDASVEVRRA